MSRHRSQFPAAVPTQPRRRRGRSRCRAPLRVLLDELQEILRRHGNVAAASARAVGSKTRRERRVVMTKMIRDLFRSGYKLMYFKNFGKKHVLAILKNWQEFGHASSTMATYVSHLRTFCRWLAKPHLLEVIQDYVDANPAFTARHTATDRDKSLRAAGVSFEEIMRRACELKDEHFCCQLMLIHSFGLRSREAWLFRPHLAAAELGQILIAWGTKGGRSRTLRLEISDPRLDVLVWAKRLVRSPPESMVPRGSTLKQWAYRYYRLCRRIGLTRRDLGVTPHSIRHEFLQDLYKDLTGVPAPVCADEGARPDVAVDRAARQIVSEDAGHSRASVVSAYLGGVRERVPRSTVGPPES